jgi:hypothetical protein
MEWKDVKGYENLYMVSSCGMVKSLGNGDSTNGNTKNIRHLKTPIMKSGYVKAKLSKCGVRRHTSVHRLVAEAFIANPENKPQVNHINGIKHDNRVENLEWVTAKENIRHSVRTGLQVTPKGFQSPCSKQVRQIAKDGGLIRVWGSIKEIEREAGYNSFGIINCCKKRKKYNTAYGYRWEYVS